MKNNLKKISAVLVAGALMAPVAHAATLEERVAELEANQSLNIFNFSGTFITRFDDIMKAEQTNPSANGAAFDSKDLSYMRMKFQFNIDANIAKNIKFYSRLTTSKHFNTFSKTGTASVTPGADLGSSNDYASSNVVLEKAYADLSIPDTNFTFSLGRLPTVDGQPQNYKDGRARMGTYPMLSYDSVLDGFAMTYKVDEYMPKDQKLALRLIYTPFSQFNVGTGGYTKAPTNEYGSKLETQTATTAAMIDYSMDNMSWADNMGIVLQHFQTGDIYSPTPAALTGAPYNAKSALSLAVAGTTLATEFNGIAHTGWDLSLSYLSSSVKSMGAITIAGNPTGFDTNNASEDTVTGGTFLLSTRYRLGSWIFGGEYVNGSEHSFYFASNVEDLTSFYSTRGDAYHLYVTKKFTQNVSLRVGYMDQQYKWTAPAFGAPQDSDLKIQTGYANLRMDF